MGAYDDLLKLLPKLSPQELQKVRQRVDGFLQVSGATTGTVSSTLPDFHDDEDWLLEGIRFELQRRGLWGDKKYLPRALFPSGYEKNSLDVRKLLLRHNKVLRGAERLAMGRLAARALGDHIEKIGLTVAPKIMLSLVSKIPVALDDAFPGYLVAGLLPICWVGKTLETRVRG